MSLEYFKPKPQSDAISQPLKQLPLTKQNKKVNKCWQGSGEIRALKHC